MVAGRGDSASAYVVGGASRRSVPLLVGGGVWGAFLRFPGSRGGLEGGERRDLAGEEDGEGEDGGEWRGFAWTWFVSIRM